MTLADTLAIIGFTVFMIVVVGIVLPMGIVMWRTLFRGDI